MGALLAIGIVAAVVGLAWRQAENPTIRRADERWKLASYAGTPDDKLTLDDAENALVLARRQGQGELAKRFEAVVASRRKAARRFR